MKTTDESIQLFLEAQLVYMAGNSKTREVFLDIFKSLTEGKVTSFPAVIGMVGDERRNTNCLKLARYPLPDVFPAEATTWHKELLRLWKPEQADKWYKNLLLLRESYRKSYYYAKWTREDEDPERNIFWKREIAISGAVRTDRCGVAKGQKRHSHLADWLKEIRISIAKKDDYGYNNQRRINLAMLAEWRPAPNVRRTTKLVHKWANFWNKVFKAKDEVYKGIAAKALLNLYGKTKVEINFPPTKELVLALREATIARTKESQTEEANENQWNRIPLLDWHPAPKIDLPQKELQELAWARLDAALRRHPLWKPLAWEQIIEWNRKQSLLVYGIDLGKHIIQVIEDDKPLPEEAWQLAQWTPDQNRTEELNLTRKLEVEWKKHRKSHDQMTRAAAWLAGIQLHEKGIASEPIESFAKEYMETVEAEKNNIVLLVLAHWLPGKNIPEAWHRTWEKKWLSRVGEKSVSIRIPASLALLKAGFRRPYILRLVEKEIWQKVESEWKNYFYFYFCKRKEEEQEEEPEHILRGVRRRIEEVRKIIEEGGKLYFSLPAYNPKPVALPSGKINGTTWEVEPKQSKA